MNIGTKIRELRKQRGITQRELAEYVRVSVQAVSKWESNSTLPDITLLPMLADFFCVTNNDLFELDIKQSTSEPCEDKKGGGVGGRYG